MSGARSISFLIIAVMMVQLSGGLTSTLTPLALGELKTGPVAIGAIAALHAAGFVFGAWVAPQALRRFGNIRLYVIGGALLAASFLSLALIQQSAWWAVMRLVQGALFAFMFTSIESWLGAAAPPAKRGGLVGLYHTAAKVSLIVGPFCIAGLSALDTRAYIWAAFFFAFSLLPVCVTQQKEPPAPERKVMSFAELYRLAPAAVVAAVMSGVANTGMTSFLPDYFKDFALGGGGTAAAALGGAVIWIAAMASQWPAGIISDTVDRRLVIALMAGVSGVSLMLVPFIPALWGEAPILIMLALWSAGALSFYGVASAHAIDRAPGGAVPQVMSGILFAWAAGSVVGPAFAGLVIRFFAHEGLFLSSGVLLAGLALYMLIRMRARPTAPDATPETQPGPEWASVMPTPLASVPLDPHSRDDAG